MLILSAAQVSQIVDKHVEALQICRTLGSTMYAITSDSRSGASGHQESESAPPQQNPLRIATQTDNHTTLYMPSRLSTSSGSATAIKVVGVPKPSCQVPGLPATTLLFDETTGGVRAVVNAGELTGLRTAAASALATLLLAEKDASNLVIFGSGTQGYYHARLIMSLLPIKHLTIIARRDTPRLQALVSRLNQEFPRVDTVSLADHGVHETSSHAVRRADIICTCVPSETPLFRTGDLKDGVHINAIGSYKPSMQEFPPELVASRDTATPSNDPHIPRILVDSRSACLAEAGELIAAGTKSSSLVELGEVVTANGDVDEEALARAQLRGTKLSLFKCVGVGGMDVAVTDMIVRLAEEQGIGTSLQDF